MPVIRPAKPKKKKTTNRKASNFRDVETNPNNIPENRLAAWLKKDMTKTLYSRLDLRHREALEKIPYITFKHPLSEQEFRDIMVLIKERYIKFIESETALLRESDDIEVLKVLYATGKYKIPGMERLSLTVRYADFINKYKKIISINYNGTFIERVYDDVIEFSVDNYR